MVSATAVLVSMLPVTKLQVLSSAVARNKQISVNCGWRYQVYLGTQRTCFKLHPLTRYFMYSLHTPLGQHYVCTER
jgi:hypothetical protein